MSYKDLRPEHRKLIDDSAISREVAESRGYRSARSKAELKGLGFNNNQSRVPALIIPIYGVDGKIQFYQARCDHPRINKVGKPIKYETPAGARMGLMFLL